MRQGVEYRKLGQIEEGEHRFDVIMLALELLIFGTLENYGSGEFHDVYLTFYNGKSQSEALMKNVHYLFMRDMREAVVGNSMKMGKG